MDYKERIIAFQNKAERDFEAHKSPATVIRYGLAFSTFMASTMYAGFTMPFRLLGKMVKADTPAAPGKVIVTKDNLDAVLTQHNRIVLDFWAEWCGPCIMMDNILSTFVDEHSGVTLGKVNADTNRSVLDRFKVRGLPHFILLENGEEVKRHAGPMTLRELRMFAGLEK